MASQKPVFLVGLMGSGKTTVGKKLASQLGFHFVDIDQALVERTGVTIAHIFEVEGEEGFRNRETRILEELCQTATTVVSTGGGIVMRDENIELMRNAGTVVYLDVPEKVLWYRLKDCQHRPLLLVENPRRKLQQLMAQRSSQYQKAAHIRIQIESDSAAKSARRIQQALSWLDGNSATKTVRDNNETHPIST
ncbi:MAG: shikimate kinase [Acidiferrobacterales bacterium]|nr:shikimate kinase [Acidiferrobacterales bacterium]